MWAYGSIPLLTIHTEVPKSKFSQIMAKIFNYDENAGIKKCGCMVMKRLSNSESNTYVVILTLNKISVNNDDIRIYCSEMHGKPVATPV